MRIGLYVFDDAEGAGLGRSLGSADGDPQSPGERLRLSIFVELELARFRVDHDLLGEEEVGGVRVTGGRRRDAAVLSVGASHPAAVRELDANVASESRGGEQAVPGARGGISPKQPSARASPVAYLVACDETEAERSDDVGQSDGPQPPPRRVTSPAVVVKAPGRTQRLSGRSTACSSTDCTKKRKVRSARLVRQ